MKKIHFLIIILFFSILQVFSQRNVNSILDSEHYYKYPRHYLSQLDTSKMQTNILIDRVITDIDLLAYDGVVTTTCGLGTWMEIYRSVKMAAIDTSVFLYPDFIENLAITYNQSQNVNIIGLIDITFDKISQDALLNGDFQEVDTLLMDNTSSENSYSHHRMVSSCLLGSSNIWGDDIKFVLPNGLIFRNNRNEEIISSEINLGDGSGFQTFDFNDTITGNYSSNSQWEEVIIKIRKKDLTTLNEIDLYSHFTFQRTGTNTVPVPDIDFLYPLGSYTSYYVYDEEYEDCISSCWGLPPNEQHDCEWDCNENYRHYFEGTARLKVTILFADGNSSGKLRRPIVLSDAFDPGNKRHYEKNDFEENSDLPYNNDGRGLYQILNGDPSPWYQDHLDNASSLINQFLSLGYDIIFVDYLSGAGDIPTNVGYLRGFFEEVLNAELYRDNLTEEIILIGPSMGGMITRYMLAQMENDGVEHYVKTWISFDAPQKGAYVSIALQHCLDFLKDIPLKKINKPAKEGIKKVNTIAAKQMLLMHYSRGNEFDNFYNEIENIGNNNGYPIFSKNYSISNGGTSKLYEGEHRWVIDYHLGNVLVMDLIGWSTQNANGSSDKIDIFNGHVLFDNSYKREYKDISYDNAPGGWLAPLYSINSEKLNATWKDPEDDNDIQYIKTSFMSTSSVFGLQVTENNIYKTHLDYSAEDTPFDVILGMTKNEEHVRISESTSGFIINELQNDLEATIRPRIRENKVLNETVSGELAYNITNDISFAGNENTFVFKNTADININSENTIHFLPGFKIEEGAKVSAKIINSNKSVTLKPNVKYSINYLKPSPYLNKISNYSKAPGNNMGWNDNVIIYPNPSQGVFTIELKYKDQSETILKVYNSFGILVKEENIGVRKLYLLDLSNFTTGFYTVLIQGNQLLETQKLIKL
jgi:triacylglycerol esterase/lipase EstA (alpha/beta hydrolase family)